MATRLQTKIDTKNDVLCISCCSNGQVISGHDSAFKIWSENGESLLHTVATPTAGEVTCSCQSPTEPHHMAISVATTVAIYDDRNLCSPLQQYHFNKEEINEICFHGKGPYLSACDDAGEIKVIHTEDNKVFRTLSGLHSNICSSVKFLPRRPWELVSGGMDCKVVRWDFNRPKPIAEVSTQERVAKSEGMLVNPPLVHSLSVWTSNHCVACGLGNGDILVYEIRAKGLELKCAASLHSSMVVCLCCIEKKIGKEHRYFIVSGANDCKIILSEIVLSDVPNASISRKCTHGNTLLQPVTEIQHCSKINWLSVSSTGAELFVADQTPFFSVYKLFQ